MGDSGSAGLLFVVGAGAVAAAAAATAALVAGSVVHTSAQSAADLTAVAVAQRLLTDADPCLAGAAVATANGAGLSRCEVSGDTVSVAVEQALPAVLARLLPGRRATATSRAEVHVDFAALPGTDPSG